MRLDGVRAVIKYLRHALARCRARRIKPGGLLPTPWDAWKLDDDAADALRYAVAKINQRITADFERAVREARPPRRPTTPIREVTTTEEEQP
jgi:hypothetical protein